jgi:Putative Ig domain
MHSRHVANFRVVFLFFIASLIANVALASAPDCSKAVASPSSVWPPNHKFQKIAVMGVTDPDGDATRIVVNCIKQDEPLNTTGDGNTEYDGYGIGESFAYIRKERSGNRNARFYHIGFTAFDTNNESCTGKVLVSVAHNPPRPPIDEGPLYFSTQQQTLGCDGIPLNNPPVITSEPVVTVQAGSPYAYDVEAFDADGDVLMYSLLTFPANMTIDSATGLINWLPSQSDVGNVQVTVQVSDGKGGTAEQTFTISVTPISQNNPPEIISEPELSVQVGFIYLYDVEAVDIDGDVLTYSLLVSPNGMTIESASGFISWEPLESDIGEVEVHVLVEDGNGGSAEQIFVINVSVEDPGQ